MGWFVDGSCNIAGAYAEFENHRGLTRGSRMSEHQRAIWVMSRPACAQANISMQHLTGVHHNSSEQTTDLSDARQHRDFKDLNTIKLFFEERNPFVIPEGFVSISTGMHASSDVNGERAKKTGIEILKKMHGKCPKDFSFKRKDQAITLASKNTIKI